jgi:hypothetical protein
MPDTIVVFLALTIAGKPNECWKANVISSGIQQLRLPRRLRHLLRVLLLLHLGN